MDNLAKYKGMAKEEFLGTPIIIPPVRNMESGLFVPKRVANAPLIKVCRNNYEARVVLTLQQRGTPTGTID